MFDLLDLPCVPRPRDAVVGWRGDAPVSYGEFLQRTRDWHALLQAQPGQNFALFFSDSIEFSAALLGAWHAGKTIYLPADALPATCRALAPSVHGYLGEFPQVYQPLAPVAGRASAASGGLARLNPHSVALVVFTSGSTGVAQSIPKRLSQLAVEIGVLEALFGAALGAADVVATVSHQHIYGLLFKLLWPLAAARPIHARSFSFPEELAAVTARRDCILVSSPAHLKRLPESESWRTAGHRLHAVFSSGGPLPADVARESGQWLGRAPIEVYGSSETGGIAWRQRSRDGGEAWQAMPGVQWRVHPKDEVLEVRSPHLPDDDWFRTADRAQASGDACFLLHGRVDRIVKIEEKRISLDMIESQLAASPLVAQSRALVLEGKRSRVAAFVVPTAAGKAVLDANGKLALNNRLRDALAQGIERVALPRVWHYLDALPVNPQGKTTYAELIALLDPWPENPTAMPNRRLVERDARRAVFELVAPQDLVYFEGHFPGTPILPGVAQVEWAIAIGRECFDLPAHFRGMQALKFQRVILPGQPFLLELQHDPIKSSLAFRYASGAEQHASGRILFGGGDV